MVGKYQKQNSKNLNCFSAAQESSNTSRRLRDQQCERIDCWMDHEPELRRLLDVQGSSIFTANYTRINSSAHFSWNNFETAGTFFFRVRNKPKTSNANVGKRFRFLLRKTNALRLVQETAIKFQKQRLVTKDVLHVFGKHLSCRTYELPKNETKPKRTKCCKLPPVNNLRQMMLEIQR